MNEIRRDYRTMIFARLAVPVISGCILGAFALGVLLGGAFW